MNTLTNQALLENLKQDMFLWYAGDPKRIQHFIKVHSFARSIGIGESLSERELFTLEAAAIVHDIGIKPAEQHYGSCSGKLQEQEGPAPAGNMLRALGFSEDVTQRVCYLVAHHHTYTNVDGTDYRILLEADFLVNAFEDNLSNKAIAEGMRTIFRTKTGTEIGRRMYCCAFNSTHPLSENRECSDV